MATQNDTQNLQGTTRGSCRCRVSFDDAEVDQAATAAVITWAEAVANHPEGASNPPANSRIVDAYLIRLTDFVGGAISVINVDLGDAGNDDELIAAADLFTGAKATAAVTTAIVAATRVFEAAYTPIITFAATGANLSVLTAGAFEMVLVYETPDPSPRVIV